LKDIFLEREAGEAREHRLTRLTQNVRATDVVAASPPSLQATNCRPISN
jgi:hypothetical protein